MTLILLRRVDRGGHHGRVLDGGGGHRLVDRDSAALFVQGAAVEVALEAAVSMSIVAL